MIKGERNPHTDHIATIDVIIQVNPRAVAVGIIRGQYISQGKVIFFTKGNQNVKYKHIVTFAAKLKTARFKANRFTRLSLSTTFLTSKYTTKAMASATQKSACTLAVI
jgi:hypothetical protein